ncbi:hypothetical protein [Nonomuraea sediminis]|uniref:hypothetical protein n=1 Tax=Nonomuraea sediminis TaxID=2835864 RepID=UPI001BDCCFCD|nr:hypothetical protein [Nonomuraea sediminis]
MTVLITGGRAPVALDLARKFARSGVRVVVAESSRGNLCRASKAVDRTHPVPPPRQAPEAFADALVRIVKREGVDLVVPTCEEIFYVSRARDRLLEHCEVLAAPLDTLRRLHSKWEFIRLAESWGLPVPRTELGTWSHDGTPYVTKPEFSRFGTQVRFGGPIPKTWVAQERLDGPQVCTYSVARDGRLAAHAAYAVDFTASGACVSFEPVDHPAAEEWVTTFVARLGFTGQIAFDFVAGDRVLPLECNPRATSGVHLLGDELTAALMGESRAVARPDPGKRAMIAMAMLSFGLANVRSARDLRRWARFVATAEDVIATPGDRGPFVAQFGVLWRNWIRSLWTGRTLVGCSTYDIEWNGR